MPAREFRQAIEYGRIGDKCESTGNKIFEHLCRDKKREQFIYQLFHLTWFFGSLMGVQWHFFVGST
jgi:hypothetical protein